MEPIELTRPVDLLTVVEQPTRSLVLLRSHYDQFILRDTCHFYGENKAVVCNVWLKREELERLKERIEHMLTDKVINSPAPPRTSSTVPAKSRLETRSNC